MIENSNLSSQKLSAEMERRSGQLIIAESFPQKRCLELFSRRFSLFAEETICFKDDTQVNGESYRFHVSTNQDKLNAEEDGRALHALNLKIKTSELLKSMKVKVAEALRRGLPLLCKTFPITPQSLKHLSSNETR